jgi:hypothetical protein
MEDLPKVAVCSTTPDQPEERNRAILYENVREDPDYPVVPIWSEESVAQHIRLDFIT